MKKSSVLLLVCAALFLFETGGATLVSGQKRSSARSGKTASKPAAKPMTRPTLPPKTVLAPTITKIDFEGLKTLLRSSAAARRPLLVNFWATWCPPCREEFPELVKIDREYRPQGLEFVTVSLDDLAEINRDVPAFLTEMKSTIPAYLLKTADEETAIHSIAPDWRGALPLTVLYDAGGKPIFTRMGAVKPEILRAQIEKTITVKEK